MRRLMDLLISALLLALLAVPIAGFALYKKSRLHWIPLHGRLGVTVRYPVFILFPRRSRLWFLNYALILLSVVAGSMSLIGPRPVWRCSTRPAYARTAARPGLVSAHLLQMRARIAHNDKNTADGLLIREISFKNYLSLLARFLVSLAFGRSGHRTPDHIELLNIRIANHTMESALGSIRNYARGNICTQLAFVNSDCLNISSKNHTYQALLQRLPLVLADGIGIHMAIKWFTNAALRGNVNGTDMFPRLCQLAQDEGLSLYLLGAKPGVAETVAANATLRFPGLKIAGARDGYFSAHGIPAVIEHINRSGADILLVAMGVPQQELWIAEHQPMLKVKVAMGVGGLFDFYSGRIRRAPLWMREIGLEWAYRLLQEPGRMWRRYVVGNPLFSWRVWRWSSRQQVLAKDNAASLQTHQSDTHHTESQRASH